MGELVVELELLARGWHVGNFNDSMANSAGWDLFAAKQGATIKVRVKAKRPGIDCFRWSAKSDGTILLGLSKRDPSDFVAAVTFHSQGGYDVYILPAAQVEEELNSNHAAYLKTPKLDGLPRKNSPQRNLFLNDKVNGPVGHGYLQHWLEFKNAWHLIDATD
jgi:hypothetical protein